MRMASAESIKTSRRGRICKSVPTVGTKIRALYDAYMLHPATPIYPCQIAGENAKHCHPALVDFYGLDIRYYGRGAYWLVGHYGSNGEYTDFIAHRVRDVCAA